MTPAQTNMYWSLIQRLRDVAEGKGLKFGDVERHAFHRKALGVAKSSKDFTNADLDKIKAHALAILEPDNLAAQLKVQDQGELRRVEARARCMNILEELGIGEGHDMTKAEWLRGSYLDGLVKKVMPPHVSFEALTDKQANVVLGILVRRVLSHRRKLESVPF
jgi:hypothetical protein